MKIHIIGVAGKATSGVAKMFRDLGHIVTGSDQGIYPPASTFLEKEQISVFTSYDESHVPNDLDFVVVGGNALIITKNNPEIEKAKELGIPIKTYPDVLSEFVVKENSIVVVGNYGKGTITGAIVKVLRDLGEDPSYMIGGQLIDGSDSLHIGVSEWSVLEGDEYPEPNVKGTKPESKFFTYRPKYLVLTSAEWDHFDQFPTEDDYIQNYIRAVKMLPSDGLLVAYQDGENISKIITNASCKVVTYSLVDNHATCCTDKIGFQPKLIGRFNQANLTAVYTLLTMLGFDSEKVLQSLNEYKGLVQRMNVVHEDTENVLVRDYAHSPIKAKSAIAAAKEQWPQHTLVAVLDIYASSLKNRVVLPRLEGALNQADLVLIPKVKLNIQAKDNSVTGLEITQAIRKTQSNVEYIPKIDNLVDRIISIKSPKVVLLMSSGGLEGLEDTLDQYFDNHD